MILLTNAQGIVGCNMYGCRLRNKETGKEFSLWFDDPEEMELHIKLYSREVYEIVEYLHEQQELIFDIDK